MAPTALGAGACRGTASRPTEALSQVFTVKVTGQDGMFNLASSRTNRSDRPSTSDEVPPGCFRVLQIFTRIFHTDGHR